MIVLSVSYNEYKERVFCSLPQGSILKSTAPAIFFLFPTVKKKEKYVKYVICKICKVICNM